MPVYDRRHFFYAAGAGLFGTALLGARPWLYGAGETSTIRPCGPGSKYVPRIMASVVRRKGDYGMLWPGAIYDGEAARSKYTQLARERVSDLGLNLQFTNQPLHSLEEAETWLAEAKKKEVDGLFIILLDRQEHSWPSVFKAADSGIPTVVFSPLGSAFTVNTHDLAQKEGIFICCTDDFSQAAWGLKMLGTLARLREMRFVVLEGSEKKEQRLAHFGTRLRYLPAADFIREYRRVGDTAEVRQMAAEYIRSATRMSGATEADVINGVKSFVAAGNILEREAADGITMDCLGALGKTDISLPCISWARMNDCGIPAACEADIGACLTHALVQFLFDRPGFQQDPVPETSKCLLIGSHCSCPTRLRGFDRPAEPYYISHHHGMRDAVPRTMWQPGERVTVADVLIEEEAGPGMVISSGEVVDNISVPPAGGCVVAVSLKLDGLTDPLAYPGFHQLFFYGDFKQQLKDYCRLAGIQPMVV